MGLPHTDPLAVKLLDNRLYIYGVWFYVSLGGPTNVKARKSFIFAEGSIKVENKEHLIDFDVTLYYHLKPQVHGPC